MANAILNNYGILESIVGFLDCKSMVQLSLACKQLCSDVNKIALSLLLSVTSTEFVQRQDDEEGTPATNNVFEELNYHWPSDESWAGTLLEWLETNYGIIKVERIF